eukprot:m.13656 g.13656  ORF g.13656 m.13656 type:complete len:82 (+) comp10170_c0_seq4:2041-2286(+)
MACRGCSTIAITRRFLCPVDAADAEEHCTNTQFPCPGHRLSQPPSHLHNETVAACTHGMLNAPASVKYIRANNRTATHSVP